jgi:amidase
LRITEDYDAIGLAEAIRRRHLKCVDVARAFCKVLHLALIQRKCVAKFTTEGCDRASIDQLFD